MKAKHIFRAIAALLLIAAVSSCSDYETYGDRKDKERAAIKAFISDQKIKVISETEFDAHGQTTDVAQNEYVYLDNSAIYLQIVRRGTGGKLEDNKRTGVLMRYTEYNINEGQMQSRNDYDARTFDKMTVLRTGTTYTASFVSGVMKDSYGASVPAGWLVPFQYINLGRQTTSEGEIALVKMIVPHSQGHSGASQSVYACHYVISYETEK